MIRAAWLSCGCTFLLGRVVFCQQGEAIARAMAAFDGVNLPAYQLVGDQFLEHLVAHGLRDARQLDGALATLNRRRR